MNVLDPEWQAMTNRLEARGGFANPEPAEVESPDERATSVLRKGNFSPRELGQSFSNFEIYDKEQQPVVDFMKSTASPWLLLLGPCGTGKDHLLSAWCRQTVIDSKFRTVLSGTVQSLFRTYRERAFGEYGNEEKAFNNLANVKILILRDVGTRLPTESERALLIDLCDHRYQHHKMLAMSGNLTPAEFAKFTDPRIADRYFEMAVPFKKQPFIVAEWPSYRRNANRPT